MVANAAADAVDRVGLPECRLNLAQAAAYLALAPKSNASYRGIQRPRPTSASTAPRRLPHTCGTLITRAPASSVAAMGYVYPHDEPGGVAGQPVMPEGLEAERFYDPTDRGFEAELDAGSRRFDAVLTSPGAAQARKAAALSLEHRRPRRVAPQLHGLVGVLGVERKRRGSFAPTPDRAGRSDHRACGEASRRPATRSSRAAGSVRVRTTRLRESSRARAIESAAHGAARVLQPGDRRADRRGRDDRRPTRCRRSSTTSPRSSPSGRSCRSPTAPGTCAGRPTCWSRRSTRSPSCSPASRESRSPRATRWRSSRRSTSSTGVPTPARRSSPTSRSAWAQALFLSKKAKFSYEPLGVVGVIAPWNYPWSIPFDEVAMALMAGNGVVLKPASLTPLLGERIRETFEKAGLPEGLVRVVHGGGAVGRRSASRRRGRSSSPARSRWAARSARSAPRS